MQKIRLLQAVCTVAMLAAVPAFAQSNMTPDAAGNARMPDTADHQATPGKTSMSDSKDNMAPMNKATNKTSMAPANDGANKTSMAPAKDGGDKTSMAPAKDGLGVSATEDSHATHRSTMAHSMGMKHGKTTASQDNAVNNLNDQSYQAAQKGEAFGGRGSDAASSDMAKPSGSGSMNDMSGGSMSGSGHSMSGGAMAKPGSDGSASKP